MGAGWVWLDSRRVELGRPDANGLDDEQTIWLYADPRGLLGVSPSADEDELRRAYRRLAREHHPDTNRGDAEAVDRFHDVRQAYAAATGDAEVTVEPTSGTWWRLTDVSAPWSPARGSLAVAGLSFEVHEPHRVPLRGAQDTVRVTYAGRTLALPIRYGGSLASVWRARIAVAAEWSLLVLLCLVLVPLVALIAAADLYLLSGANALLAWVSVLGIVGLGYGALAAILAGTGHEVPTPRRAVRRTRAAVAELRALHASRTKPG